MPVLKKLFCNWEESDMVEWKTLEEIANYRRGSFPQPYGKEEWYNGEGAMPFVQVADVEESAMCLKATTKQYISKLAMPMSVYVPQGSIVVTLQGSIGKVAITQYDSYVDRTLGIFTGFKTNIDKKYFTYQLHKIFSEKKEKARGGTIKTITKEEFSHFQIPIPSKEEQTRIVEILDTFTASIANLKEQIKERRKQYEYYRDQLLDLEGKDGVEMKTLGEVCSFRNGFAFKSGKFKETGLPIIRITNISNNNIDLEDCKYFDIDDYRGINFTDFAIVKGDILIAMSGATTGKIGEYKACSIAYLNQRVGKFIPDVEKLHKRFLYHYLLGKNQEIYMLAGGGAQPNLSSNKLMSELYIPIPAILEQTRIVTILDQFEASIANLEAQLKEREKQYEYYRNQLLTFE